MLKKPDLAFLLLAVFWIACDPSAKVPTAPNPEAAASHPAASEPPEGGLTVVPSAALASHSSAEVRAVRVARRYRELYGASWKDIVATLRQLGNLTGRSHMQNVADIIQSDARMSRLLSEIPDLSDSEKAERNARLVNGWNILRDRIAQDDRAPVPPAYDELGRGRTADARGRDTLRSLERLLEMHTGSLADGSGLKPMFARPFTVFLFTLVGVQYDPNCLIGCRRDALDILQVLYEECDADYDACCAAHGPCTAGSPGRERCLGEWNDCIEDAQDYYRRWFSWCIRWCRF